MSLAIAATAAALFGLGTYLLLQRQLSRMIIGIGLIGNGANLVILSSAGGRGEPVFLDGGPTRGLADPLPQALILTAIVISFGAIAFLLALAFRGWSLTGSDEVEDDVEDRLVATRGGTSEDVVDAAASEASEASETDDNAERAP